MESIEADDIFHTDWDRVLFNKIQTTPSKKAGRNLVVLTVIIFLHIGIVGYFLQWRELTKPKMDVLQEALEITFIKRAATAETAAAPLHANKNTVVKKFRTALYKDRDVVEAPLPAENSDKVSAGSLRLTLDNDEWNSPPVVTETNPLRRQYVALPGRAEPFVNGIKLRNRLSPQQKLAMLGKLLGAVEYDPCIEARKRLVSGQSQINEIDLEADLRSIEQHCHP